MGVEPTTSRMPCGSVVVVVDVPVEDRPGDSRLPKIPSPAVYCLEGSWGARIVAALPVARDDVIVPTRRYSGFFQTVLGLHLRERHINQVVVTGVYWSATTTDTLAYDAWGVSFFDGTLGGGVKSVEGYVRAVRSAF